MIFATSLEFTQELAKKHKQTICISIWWIITRASFCCTKNL